MLFQWRRPWAGFVGAALVLAATAHAQAQTAVHRLGQLDLSVLGVSAGIQPLEPVVPKNIASAVRIVVRNGERELSSAEISRFLGTGVRAQAELSGPGLSGTITLPYLRPGDVAPADPLLLPLPALPISGDYALSSIRLVAQGTSVLDVFPADTTVKVIEQVLVTSVKTRPLTMDEIRGKGIVLDSDDYLGFEFTLGLALESESIQMTLPVVFDRSGAEVPIPPTTGVGVARDIVGLPTIRALLLQPVALGSPDGMPNEDELKLPNGEPIRIPSLLVIPGNVGYLKQFFSAQLYVANGAPVGSGLIVRDVTGTIHLPAGGALSLPELSRDGETIVQPSTMPIRGVGADGLPGTDDDAVVLDPAQQGQAEFLLRGEQEGFHTLQFDIVATLDGLPIGPVQVSGQAKGGVLVRNPYFDVSFTVPSIVRQDEEFPVYVTLTNTGKGAANDVNIQLDQQTISNAVVIEPQDGKRHIDSIAPGSSQTVVYRLKSLTTGQVYATYLRFDTDGAQGDESVTGGVRFRVGVGERGVPLSPDTLTLPTSVDELPLGVVRAAMRVLGQAWSIANAAPGTLPSSVRRISQGVVVNKARALAEAGLRVSLGESESAAVRDLLIDFYGGESVDPGFDQLLRQTAAGRDFARALGAALADTAALVGGPLAYERELAQLAASGQNFISFAAAGGEPVDVSLSDEVDRQLVSGRSAGETGASIPRAELAGGVLVPLGPVTAAPMLGFVSRPTGRRFVLSVSGAAEVAVTYPRGGGSHARALVSTSGPAQIIFDLSNPSVVRLRESLNGSVTETELAPAETLVSEGPALISANVIGPESFEGASPFGINTAVLFDRPVDAVTANRLTNYAVPANEVLWAQRQLSGRLVFLRTAVPEGAYVPTHVAATGVADWRGVSMAGAEVALGTRITTPGAVVTGRVVNADGTPASIEHIYYRNILPPPTPHEAVVGTIPLSASGAYEIRYVRQASNGAAFRLSAVDPTNGVERNVSGHVRSAGERIVLDIALIGKGSVTGIVSGPRTDGTLGPVGGAVVEVRSQLDGTVGANAVTDGDGRYTITGITVGPVTVRAKLNLGLGTGWGRIERAGTTATIDILLDSSGSVSVSGIVWTERAGEMTKAENALVVFRVPAGLSYVPLAYTYTNQEGRYTFTEMPYGGFMIQASTPDGAASQTGVGASGPVIEVSLVIRVESKGIARGVVRYPNGAAAAGVVVARDISSAVVEGAVLTGADGTFALPGIPIGTPTGIGAVTMDRTRTGTALVSIPVGADSVDGVTIRLSEMGEVEFHVVDPAGKPVAGQQVRLMTGGLTLGTSCADPCGCNPMATDSTGTVRYSNLPLGTYEARAVRTQGGYTDMAQGEATTRGEGEVGVGVLRFAGAGTVSGTAIPPAGVIATGGKVELTSRVFVRDAAAQICDFRDRISHQGYVDVVTNEFSFANVNVGRVSVKVENPFFPPAGAKGVLVRHGDELHLDVPLVDKTIGEVGGMVFLPDGVTSAGAGVEVSLEGALPKVSGRTDEAGHYRIASILPEGRYTQTAIDPITGGVMQQVVDLKAGQDVELDLRLLGRGTVRVTVEDAGGQLAERATLTLRETHYPNREFEAVIQPNDQGVAVLERVFEGTFAVEASDVYGRGGRASGTLSAPDETVDVVITLNATGTVRGRFLRPEGSELQPVSYGIVSLRLNGRPVAETTTSSDPETLGAFAFDYVKGGSYSLEATDPLTRRVGHSASFAMPAEGGTIQQDVVAQGLGTVRGLVSRSYAGGAPTPEAGARVEINTGGFTATTRTGLDGRYEAVGVPEGAITVKAAIASTGAGGSGGFLTGAAGGELTGDGATVEINVTLRASTGVAGVVQTAQGGALSAPVRVKIIVGGVGGYTQETLTDGTGAYSFSIVPAGTATIDVTSLTDIDRAHVANVEVDPDQAQNGVVALQPIRLNGIGSISGLARRAGGAPVAGALAFEAKGSLVYRTQLTSGADGVFSLPQFLAGAFSVQLTTRADFLLRGSLTDNVQAGETKDVNVVLEPNADVAGRVVASAEPGAAGVAGATVVVKLAANRGSYTAVSGVDGVFHVRGVPVGQHTVLATGPDGVRTGGVPLTVTDADEGATLAPVIALEDNPVRVESMTPDTSAAVPVSTPVTLTFSSPLRWASGIRVLDGTLTIGLRATLSADARSVTLSAGSTSGWPDGRTLSVVVTTDVMDIFGRHPAAQWTGTFRTVDLSPPRVLTTIPANKAIEVTDATLVVTFSEPLSAAGVADVRRSGQAVPTSSLAFDPGSPNMARFHIDAALINDSTYSVTINGAVDQNANTQTAAASFSFKTTDTVAPTISLAAPSTAWVATAMPRIAVSFSDATSGIDAATAQMKLDGAVVAVSIPTAATTMSHTPASPLAEGKHTVTAEVRDRAVARNLAVMPPREFGVDTVGPTAPTGSISDGQRLTNPVSITASASDATSGIAKIEILLDNERVATVTADASCRANPAAVCTVSGSFGVPDRYEGARTLTLRSVDDAGNAATSAAIAVVVDNRPGTVSGTISGSDDQLYVGPVTVSIGTVTTTTSTGEYLLEDVPTGHRYIEARVGGQRRVYESINLSTLVPSETRNLKLCGLGTVRGTVTGAVAPGATVSLSYRVTSEFYGSLPNVTTGDGGSYVFDSIVPVGSFVVSAKQGVNQANSVSGALQNHGEVAIVNLVLEASAVNMPQSLYDGNSLPWQVRADSGLGHGYMFAASATSPQLTLVAGGTPYPFTGIPGSSPVAGTEQDKREIVIRQDGTLAGLEVTRKVFVPKDGYIVRYIEQLHNPTGERITVDVVEESNLNVGLTADPGVIDSSAPDSGVLTADDRWVVLDDADARDIYAFDPYWQFAPLASVYAGEGGRAPDEASLTGKTLRYRWAGVQVEPGQTVSFMHLMSAEADRGRATAAAERLVQFPPEVLVGLAPDEMDNMVNFRIPVDLLPLLPATDGKIAGHVFAGDGTTPIPSATVRFRSRSPYYARPFSTSSSSSSSEDTRGAFALSQSFAAPNIQMLPRTEFDLTATAPSGAFSATASITASGDLTTDQAGFNLVFAGLGVVTARALDAGGHLITTPSVAFTLAGEGLTQTVSSSTGTREFLLVPLGSYRVAATYRGMTIDAPVDVRVDSLRLTQDLVFPAFGSVQVFTLNAAGNGVNASVSLYPEGGSGLIAAGTSSGGTITFSSIPPGSYFVRASYTSGVSMTIDLPVFTIANEPAPPVTIQFPAVGTVNVTAVLGDTSTPVAGGAVSSSAEARGSGWYGAGPTGALGTLSITNVPGHFEVRVCHPSPNQSYCGTAEGTVTLASPSVDVVVHMPVLTATLSGVVTNTGGAMPLDGATVTLSSGATTTTANGGQYSFVALTPGTVTLTTSFTPAGAATASLSTSLTLVVGDNTRNVLLALPVIRGTVTDVSAGLDGVDVNVTACYGGSSCLTAHAQPDGTYLFLGRRSDWPQANFTIYLKATAADGSGVTSDQTSVYYSSTSGTLAAPTLAIKAGLVTGHVYSAQGNVTAELWRESGPMLRQWSGPAGEYVFRHVAPGSVRVHVTDEDGIPGVSLPGPVLAFQATTLDVTLVPTGQLALSLVNAQDQLQSGPVAVEVPGMLQGNNISTWSRSFDLTNDGAPAPRTVRVPAGFFRVIYDDGTTPPAAVEGDLTADQTLPAALRVGSHVRLAEVLSGGTASYAQSTVSDLWEGYPSLARPEMNGRVLLGLTAIGNGVRVRRDYYAPSSGEFGRTITWIENRSTEAASVEVGTNLSAPSDSVVTTTSDGDSDYEATDAFVVSQDGQAARALVTGPSLAGDEGSAYLCPGSDCRAGLNVRHTLSLGPGERKAFMAFAILDPTGNVDEVASRAQALTDLTRADALFGLTSEERAAIVNFSVPATGSVSGTITNAGVPVAGARVALLTARGAVATEAAAGTSGGDVGQFTLSDVSVGTYDLVAYDPATYRPGRLGDVTVSEGGTTTADLDLALTAIGAIQVEGRGDLGNQPAPAGTVVTISAEGFSRFWRPSVTLDGSNPATFSMAPVGVPLTFAFAPPATGDTSTLTLSGGEPQPPLVTLHMVETALFPIELTTAASGSYFVFSNGSVSRTFDPSCTPFCGTEATLDGNSWPWSSLARGGKLSANEVVAGPTAFGTLEAWRRTYVSQSGAFIRFVDVIENPTVTAQSVEYGLVRSMVTNGASWTLVGTSAAPPDAFDASDDYYVISAPDTAALAMIVAGPGGRERPSQESWSLSGYQNEWWPALQIPAHGKAIIVQFLVLRAPGEEAQALATAQAIVAGVTAGDDVYLSGLTAEDRAAIVNFALGPARPTLSGTVTDTGGTPLVAHTVRVTSAVNQVFEAVTDDSGQYSLTVDAVGDYTAEVVNPSGFVLAQQSVNVSGSTTLNWTIDTNVGGVHASVVDENGAVTSARVQLTDSAGTVIAEQTGSDVTFLSVPPGDYQVWAFEPPTNRPGRAAASVLRGAVSPVTVTLVPLTATGTLGIQGILEGSGAPAAGATVNVYSGEYWPQWTRMVTLDANGLGVVSGVPAGYGVISAGAPPDLGWEDWTLPAGGTLDVALRIGQRTWYPIDLTGDDGFAYWAGPGGDAHFAEGDCRPYCGSYPIVASSYYQDRAAGRLLQAGREVENGPRQMSGLTIYRRLSVPQSGRFARLLDVIHNPTEEAIHVDYQLEHDIEAPGEEWQVVASSPGSLADDSVVLSHGAAAMPEIGLVFSGPGASAPPDGEWSGEPGWQYYVSGWHALQVQPHGTAILMQFVVRRAHGDVDGTTTQTEALVNLSDTDALAGMTPLERSQVVNFVVPQP